VPAKTSPKKPATKKTAAKKTALKKAPAKKAAARKAAPKKPATKKKAAVKKKAAARKAAPKKPATKKKAAVKKKAAARKAAPKKPATKKKAAVKKKAAPKTAAAKKPAPKRASPKKKGRQKAVRTNSAELNEVSCQLATLALAKEKNPLNVRQWEQLRRALAIAGDALGWIENVSENGASIAEFSKDMTAMAKNGAKSLGRGLADELAEKKSEIAILNKVIDYARELAEDPDTVYPVDITFAHTIRDAYQEYVTKTETRVANDADEARAAAATVERSLTSWTKLSDAMIVVLKRRQKEMAQVPDSFPDFVASSRGLIGEVVANLE
jgi:hypothetical protein